MSLALVFLPRPEAATNVIYFDPFTAAAGTSLNGSAPKDHGGIGLDAWLAPEDGITMDGTNLTVTSGSRWCSLPFMPEEGNKYKLSMDMNATHTGADWFAIGFCNNPTPVADYGAQQMSGWFLIRGLNPGYPLHSFTGYGTDGGGQAGNFTGPHKISVILDTTVANWTFEYFVDDVSQRGPVPFSKTADVNPNIGFVTFGSYNSARGIMDNFRLENIYHVETGAPSIVTQPKNATVVLGGSAKFEVQAAGPKPISYQWYKNSQELVGETGSALTVTKLTAADSGAKYTVKVTNSYGTTTTAAATLTVLSVPGPLIHKFTFNDSTATDTVGGITGVFKGTTTVTSGQLVCDGSDGGFVLLSDYAMPPSGSATVVAWFRAASAIGKSARVFDFGSGTLNYFYFTPMTAAGGVARLGFKAGDDAEASISYTPTLNDDTDHMVAAVIDSTPTATGGNGTMQLYIDGKSAGSVDLNGSIMLDNLEFGPQNYFGKSQWVNTGDLPYMGYIDEVRVYNTALSESTIAALVPDANPVAPPAIDTQPKDTVASLGGSATLLVGVTGSKPLTFQWRFNGKAIDNSNTNIFTLNNVKSTDFGAYDVIISNSQGSITSVVAQVSLLRWSFEAWNDDATSGVDTNYFYTHAYNFASTAGAQINGLAFTGMGGGNPSVAKSFTLTGVGNVFNNDANNLPEGSGSRIMANDFIYGGAPGSLTLYGLTPGKEYLLTFFSVAFESPGNRRITFGGAGGQNLTVDQDAFDNDNGIRISYQYTADTNGSVVVTTMPIVAGATFHSYGFCNRLLNKIGAGEPPTITAQPESTSAALGTPAGFAVIAMGSAPLKYQWMFNGANIAGANSSGYTNSNVQSSDFGNYAVVVSNNYGAVTSAVVQLSLLRFSYTNWSDNASSGIDSKYVYTHAYSFGSGSSTTINGVAFKGIAGGNPSVANVFTVTGTPNVFNNDANNVNDTGSRTMANDFIYGGNPGVLTLYGLTPGSQYLLTIYSMGWEDSGRTIKFVAANGQQLLVDQDTYLNDNGIQIMYQYTADANGSVSVSNYQAGIGTFHTYGFSNREIPGGAKPPQITLATQSAGQITLSWAASATGYILEGTSSLSNATWTAVTGVQNNQVTITVPKTGTQYYRLRKP